MTIPRTYVQRSQIAISDKPAKLKTNLAIIDRRIIPQLLNIHLIGHIFNE